MVLVWFWFVSRAAGFFVVPRCSLIFVVLCASELQFSLTVVCSVIFYLRHVSFVKIAVHAAENGSWEGNVCFEYVAVRV